MAGIDYYLLDMIDEVCAYERVDIFNDELNGMEKCMVIDALARCG